MCEKREDREGAVGVENGETEQDADWRWKMKKRKARSNNSDIWMERVRGRRDGLGGERSRRARKVLWAFLLTSH